MGATVLRYVQVKQYLRYWETRSGTGAWTSNAGIEGHAAACRRAQKANQNAVYSGSYKGVNGRRLTHDPEHQRDHRCDPSELATGTVWPAETIGSWMSSEDGGVTDVLSKLDTEEGLNSISEATTNGKAIDAPTLSAIAQKMSGGHINTPHTDIKTSVQAWRVAADLAARLDYPHCQKPDTNDHYQHYCLAPTVVAARQEHRRLLATAIFTCELKRRRPERSRRCAC